MEVCKERHINGKNESVGGFFLFKMRNLNILNFFLTVLPYKMLESLLRELCNNNKKNSSLQFMMYQFISVKL